MSIDDDPAPPVPSSHSPWTYLIVGATLGSLASVIFVAYLNRQKALSKLRKKATGLKNSGSMPPSSGSPLTLLDDEKSA